MSDILVVDDEPSMRFLLRASLELAGHRVAEAGHGRQALELIGDGRVPDLVTTDFMMPVMDGGELVTALRRNPETAGIPLVVISSSPGAERRTAAADAFLRKPFDPSELVAQIEALLVGR